MHNQLLSSLLNIYSPSHTPLSSRTHSLMHAFASPPRHQPQTPDFLETNPKHPTFWKQPQLGQRQKGMLSHKEISQRPKSMKYTVSHKPHTCVVTMGHGRVRSISRILQHRLSTIFTFQSQYHELTSRPVILHYTYRLTCSHIGNFRDVPLIEVPVERRSLSKHCRKNRRPITFTVNIAQEKKAEERWSK